MRHVARDAILKRLDQLDPFGCMTDYYRELIDDMSDNQFWDFVNLLFVE